MPGGEEEDEWILFRKRGGCMDLTNPLILMLFKQDPAKERKKSGFMSHSLVQSQHNNETKLIRDEHTDTHSRITPLLSK